TGGPVARAVPSWRGPRRPTKERSGRELAPTARTTGRGGGQRLLGGGRRQPVRRAVPTFRLRPLRRRGADRGGGAPAHDGDGAVRHADRPGDVPAGGAATAPDGSGQGRAAG